MKFRFVHDSNCIFNFFGYLQIFNSLMHETDSNRVFFSNDTCCTLCRGDRKAPTSHDELLTEEVWWAHVKILSLMIGWEILKRTKIHRTIRTRASPNSYKFRRLVGIKFSRALEFSELTKGGEERKESWVKWTSSWKKGRK